MFEPALVEATAPLIAQLRVPAGFTIAKYADLLGKPRMLAVGSTGHVYVSNREAGTVTLLKDTNADGKSAAGLMISINKEGACTAGAFFIYTGIIIQDTSSTLSSARCAVADESPSP